MKKLKVICSIVCLLALSLVSTSAFAQSSGAKHLKYFPDDTRLLVGVNLASARNTALYAAGASWLSTQPDASYVSKMLSEATDFDPETDLHSVTVGFPDHSSTKKGPVEDVHTIVFEGNFDRKKWDKLIDDDDEMTRKKVGKLDVVKLDARSEMSFADKNTLVIVTGEDAARKKGWEVVQGNQKSVEKQAMMKKLLGKISLKKHVWAAGDLSHFAFSSRPKVGQLSLTIDATGGLKLDGIVTMADEAGAKKVIHEVNKNRPMLKMAASSIGGGALASNLKISSKERDVSIETSMTDAEVKTLFSTLVQMQSAGAFGPASPSK